jgi:hypothetical protein
VAGHGRAHWAHRRALLGGIYGRPVVFANAVLYVVGALSLLGSLPQAGATAAAWLVAAPLGALAIVYLALLFRGPFDPLGT